MQVLKINQYIVMFGTICHNIAEELRPSSKSEHKSANIEIKVKYDVEPTTDASVSKKWSKKSAKHMGVSVRTLSNIL